jgi:hypothetical protein
MFPSKAWKFHERSAALQGCPIERTRRRNAAVIVATSPLARVYAAKRQTATSTSNPNPRMNPRRFLHDLSGMPAP